MHHLKLGLFLALAVSACGATAPTRPDASMAGRGGAGGRGGMAGGGGGGTGGLGGSTGDAGSPSDTGVDSAVVPAGPDASSQSDLGGTDTLPRPSGKFPADLLNLTNWKLTLPIGAPTEIKQPQLATFEMRPYFHLDPAGHVVFRAHAGGATTSGSGYPRSELREMANQGKSNASWSTSSGTHTMIITQEIHHTLKVKPHVVAGQIHDASDDVVMVRLEGARLFVEAVGKEVGDLDPAYKLGTKFTVKIEASGGRIRVYYNDLNTPKVELTRDTSGCYFKAGVYTQSNPSRGEAADAYGEVRIHDLQITHK